MITRGEDEKRALGRRSGRPQGALDPGSWDPGRWKGCRRRLRRRGVLGRRQLLEKGGARVQHHGHLGAPPRQ